MLKISAYIRDFALSLWSMTPVARLSVDDDVRHHIREGMQQSADGGHRL